MKKLMTFIIVSLGFSWALAGLMFFGDGLSGPLAQLYLFLFMLGPAIGAIVCAFLFEKGRRLEALGFKGGVRNGLNVWLLWAWLIGIGMAILALLISILPGDISLQNPVIGLRDQVLAAGMEVPPPLEEPMTGLIVILSAVTLGAAINTPLLLSEELGWRGWLWDFLRPSGFWKTTAITGLLWGIWHAPIIAMGYNYPSLSPALGVMVFIAYCLMFSPIFSYLRERSGSVWSACVLHGTINALAGVAIMSQTSADMPWRGLVGIGGFVAMAALTLFVWKKMKGNLHVGT